ncbi:uncharacterized protein PODANS_5_1540 [Podospora anserina S mat+]|uniref:beta-glucosidase n=1 Tax=Podospora anserina (strain S / ATCC MYA-4624 / DSM 980 / FGSC 10383) TaxID=515849 RepID=B2AET8_PODAN|nr:uncharacterized protein PODANS_5_1540 [Podospora anserina S mat+]CAP61954.1 unnamed protein product [Podospora anserina S mat+]CDP29030.1 Putative protein of unknown function [Podospora anserina S mat+]
MAVSYILSHMPGTDHMPSTGRGLGSRARSAQGKGEQSPCRQSMEKEGERGGEREREGERGRERGRERKRERERERERLRVRLPGSESSGKLTVSFPYSVGDLPVYYDYWNSGRGPSLNSGVSYENGTLVFGRQYVLGDLRPLYEFGYGRSYSIFVYSDVAVDKQEVRERDIITISVTVKNTSERDGKEVLQLYVKDLIASVDLRVWNSRIKYVVEPGDFMLIVGASSNDSKDNITITLK